MKKVIKEGTKVKIKTREELEQLLDDHHRIEGLYFDDNMFDYCGQELEVVSSWWSYSNERNYFTFEGIEWTWNLQMIEEVGEENMRDLDRTCADCGREIDEDEELTSVEGGNKHVCPDCLDNYEECYDCGNLVHRDSLHYVRDRYGDEVQVCDDCINEYEQCSDCGDYFPRDEMYYDDDEYGYYCESCWENSARHLISGYHDYHRGFEFHKASDEVNPKRYIGSELEMENDSIDSDCVRYLRDEFDAILAHDGSLDGDGAMEWVDDPRSLKAHYEIADKKREAFNRLVRSGYRSHDTSTCGLHFHVSRPYQEEINTLNYYNDEDRKKIEELRDKQEDIINRIILVMETYKEELIRFSRRKDTYWCKWLSDVVTCDNGKITSLDFIKKVKGESMGHHRALNLENKNTIEFRIFKGTLNFDTYMASLELVNNIVELCGDLEFPLEKITWDKLTRGQYVTKYVIENDIHTSRKVVDTSEIDRIWEIVKNKKKIKTINKLIKEFNKYYQVYVTKFENIKDSDNWSLICDTTAKLRDFSGTFKGVIDYKNNNEYDKVLYKMREVVNYNMYFDTDELYAIRKNIQELLREVQ